MPKSLTRVIAAACLLAATSALAKQEHEGRIQAIDHDAHLVVINEDEYTIPAGTPVLDHPLGHGGITLLEVGMVLRFVVDDPNPPRPAIRHLRAVAQ